MTVFTGLNADGDVDTTLFRSFGIGETIPIPADGEDPDQKYIRLDNALKKACECWVDETGVEYGLTESEVRYFDLRRPVRDFCPGLFQNITEILYHLKGTETEEEEDFSSIKLSVQKGAFFDTIVKDNGAFWRPGRYKMTGVWGLSADDLPEDVKVSVLRYAAALYSEMSSAVGGMPYNPETGVVNLSVPSSVYRALKVHRSASSVFSVPQ